MSDFPLDGSEVPENFRHVPPGPTRWNEFDGHRPCDNARYRAFFDWVIMLYAMLVDGFDLLSSAPVPVTVKHVRRFHRPLQFPAASNASLRASSIGTSSARDGFGLVGSCVAEICARLRRRSLVLAAGACLNPRAPGATAGLTSRAGPGQESAINIEQR